MNSLVARLRGRLVSQSSTSTQSDFDEHVRTPSTPTFSGDSFGNTTENTTRSPIDRKILPHVNELLDSYNSQEGPASNEDRSEQGLSPPPTRRNAAVTFNFSQKPSDTRSHTPSPALGEGARSDSPATPPSDNSSARFTGGTLTRISQRISSAGVWSTFGRHKDRRTPPVSGSLTTTGSRFTFGSADTFAGSPQSQRNSMVIVRPSESAGSFEHYRRPSESSGALPAAQSNVSSRRPSCSVAFTIDENNNEQHSSRSQPSQNSSSQSSFSLAATSQTPAMQSFDLSHSSSPGTFGQDCPMPSSAFRLPSSSPPPPLPPLNHPELVASLTSRSHPILRELPTNDATPILRHWNPALHGKTFPPRRRRRKTDGSIPDENTVPFPSTTRRRGLRASASMPRVRHLFQSEQRRSRSSTRAPSRRTSAEWAAAQASLNSAPNSSESWPAAVSREMLRLSLGIDGGSSGRSSGLGDAFRAANAETVQRVGNVPASEPRPCSPLLSPRSPSVLAEEPAEGGDKQSWPHSDSNNRTSQNPAGVVEAERGMRDGDLSPVTEDVDNGHLSATFPSPSGTRSNCKSILRASSPIAQGLEAGPSSSQRSPKGTISPPRRLSTRRHPSRHSSEPALASVLETPPSTKRGKRKAEDLDITPPDVRHKQHATFLLPVDHRRANSLTEAPRTPKRVRLSASPAPSPAHSRPGSSYGANNTGSLPNRLSAPPSPTLRPLSHANSTRSMQPSVVSNAHAPSFADSRRERRGTPSDMSIPIGAIVSPQPPSLSRSSTYHMRDPRRPPRVHPTPWTPHLHSDDEDPSPPHAWCFYIGFILFPLWWIASLMPIPRTRHVGGTDTEKAVTLDDPQVEHDARSWRFRCRIMAAISLLTYVPFIVLVAIFAPR